MAKDLNESKQKNNIENSSPEKFASNSNSNPKLKEGSTDKYVNPQSKTKEQRQQNEIKEFFKTEFETSINDLRLELKTESQDTKKEFLTFFGLFASFMTFLSIEVQILKTNNNISEILGISILILSFLMFFAIILNDISKDVNDFKVFIKPMYVLTFIFVLVGSLMLYDGNSISKENIDMKKKNINIHRKVDSLNKKIHNLNKKIQSSTRVTHGY